MINLARRILTIDDTHEGNLVLAEMMARKGLKDNVIFFCNLNENNYIKPIIKRLHDLGFVIGNHTVNHLSLNLLSPSGINYEIEEAEKIIEFITGKGCYYLSYPYGDFNDTVTKIAKDGGYRFARTCLPETDDEFNKASYYLDGTEEGFINATKTSLRMYHLHAISIENFNSYSVFSTFLDWLKKENS